MSIYVSTCISVAINNYLVDPAFIHVEIFHLAITSTEGTGILNIHKNRADLDENILANNSVLYVKEGVVYRATSQLFQVKLIIGSVEFETFISRDDLRRSSL